MNCTLLLPLALCSLALTFVHAAEPAPSTQDPGLSTQELKTAIGFRGIWYMNQPQNDQYKFKYSGGFGTYPQQHIPMAAYSQKANKTFFVFGGKIADENKITNMVAYYDHATGQVSRPRAVISRQTNDTHYNPTLGLDEAGHVYVFCNSHGVGYELKKDDPTHGKSYIFRSTKPGEIDSFQRLPEDNFSYSQCWPVAGKGLLWLHTRYAKNNRRIFFSTSADGLSWSKPAQLHNIQQGGYQISWARDNRVATAMDMHPDKGHLNARTNIYYLETRDFGQTWTTADGKKVDLPLNDAANPALIRDFQKEGLLVYLKDLTFDAAGNPIILFLTSKGYKSGPEGGPRTWHTARWDGAQWVFRKAFDSDHNYDHGSLYIENAARAAGSAAAPTATATWRIIAPTEPGPQPFATGGQIAIHQSQDQGQTWTKTATFPLGDAARNATYIRRPLNANPGFYAYWADGNAYGESESDLYFGTKDGKIFRLPRKMTADMTRAEEAK